MELHDILGTALSSLEVEVSSLTVATYRQKKLNLVFTINGPSIFECSYLVHSGQWQRIFTV